MRPLNTAEKGGRATFELLAILGRKALDNGIGSFGLLDASIADRKTIPNHGNLFHMVSERRDGRLQINGKMNWEHQHGEASTKARGSQVFSVIIRVVV